MRRVAWVRVTTGPSGTKSEVVGIRHRGTDVTRIPLRVAARLAADGVPVVVHRHD
ncbi:MAG: hypothetical protein QOF60_3274 [Actinomycetota bacterium]|nr:hypothetical protein [Actinomycetota bacterium]